jgi:hypothetical protein
MDGVFYVQIIENLYFLPVGGLFGLVRYGSGGSAGPE